MLAAARFSCVFGAFDLELKRSRWVAGKGRSVYLALVFVAPAARRRSHSGRWRRREPLAADDGVAEDLGLRAGQEKNQKKSAAAGLQQDKWAGR